MDASGNTPKLYDAINDFKEIRVDDYQRTYSWTADQIDDLLADISETVRTRENHFFGTLIFQIEAGGNAKVVDGQQRLSTIFIIMAKLRDAIEALGPEYHNLPVNEHRRLPIAVLSKAYEFLYSDLEKGITRFHTNPFLDELLQESVFWSSPHQKSVLKRGAPISKAMRKAILKIRASVDETLKAFDEPVDKLVAINEMIDAIRSRFLVLRVQTSKTSESLEIFLTLNNRGLPLGPSDLVRGHIMSLRTHGESPQREREIFETMLREWKTVTDRVEDAEAYLRHYLVATTEEKIQKKVIFRHIETALEDDEAHLRKTKAIKLWDDIVQSSEFYSQTISPSMGGKTQYYIEIMNRILKSYRIPVFATLKADYTDSEKEEIIRLIYVLSIRWVMDGGNAQVLEDYFQTNCTAIRGKAGANEIQLDLKTKIKSLNLDSRGFFETDGDADFIGKAVLHAIDLNLSHANDYALNRDIHLEHIAPQSPTPHWKESLLGNADGPTEEYDKITCSLGNLTLLDKDLNTEAQQQPINEKVSNWYRDATPKMTRDFDDLDGPLLWNLDFIGKRLDWLTEMFDSAVGLVPPNRDLPAFSDWLRND